MKNKLKKLIISASSISALIGLSAGSYFLYTFLNQNKEQIVDNNSVNVKIPLNNNDLSDYIDIVEMPTKFLKDSNINSFMFTKLNSKGEKDTSALETLGKEFIKRVFYGPEILQLKKIIIGGNDFFNNSDKTLGFYTSATNSIYINSRFFAEKIFFQNKIKINNDFSFQNNWTEVANDEEKIEIIMPTLFHEYGHHIASVYANNNNFGDIYDLGKNDNNIYFNDINNNQGTTSQNWNKEFVKDFKNVFSMKRIYYPLKE